MTTITEQIEALGYGQLLGNYEQDTPEWHEARKGISATDIGTILGKNPWKSAYTLWAEKTGQVAPQARTRKMRLGQLFEDPIAQMYAEEHPFQTVHNTGTWASQQYPTWKANPDRVIEFAFGDLGLLEIKFTGDYWDDVPLMYWYQVQWQMHITGLRRAIIAVVNGRDYAEFEIEYDEETMSLVEMDVKRFEKRVADGIAPDWDGSESTYETVRKISPNITEGAMELGDLWVNMSNAKAAYDDAERLFTSFKSATISALQGNKFGLYQGQIVLQLQNPAKPYIKFK